MVRYSLSPRELFFSFALLVYFSTFSQNNRYPATVNPVLNPPYSLFLEDYTDPNLQLLLANVIFNDFNESSWTFKLNLRISSSDGGILLQTRSGFTPSQPITLVPGELRQFTSTDWIEYLNLNNISVSGNGARQLTGKGRLPEGLYEVCIQIRDFETSEPLSPYSCTSAWIQLDNPPLITSPICGQYLDPKSAQIPFQWQLFSRDSPNNRLGTEFSFHLYEMTDQNSNPQNAVRNGQALKIFEAQNINHPNFLYSLSEPALEKGKEYIFQVRASDLDGKDRYKNNGLSEFCNFYFGWPKGGNIPLVEPKKDAYIGKKDVPTLVWGAPDNKLPNQGITYEVTVVEKEETQSPDHAIVQNSKWYFNKSPLIYSDHQQIDTFTHINPMQEYAWMVKAFSDFQEVASSKISTFFGPNLMDYFYAGNHKILVDRLNGKDLSNISGTGKARLSQDGKWEKISFNKLKILDKGGYYVLAEGEITIKKEIQIELTPQTRENGNAKFLSKSFRFDNKGLSIYGHIEWDLPFPAISEKKSKILSRSKWLYYDQFTLFGGVKLRKEVNEFELLDPFGFHLSLDTTSYVYLNNNDFKINFSGTVSVPLKVQGKTGERVAFSFSKAEQLYYFPKQTNNRHSSNQIRLISNTGVWTTPLNYTIDLSATVSSSNQSIEWKGIDIHKYDLIINDSPDHLGQIKLKKPHVKSISNSGNENFLIHTKGVNFDLNYKSKDLEYKFQTFPVSSLRLNLSIKDSRVNESSFLTGAFILPVIDTLKEFHFISPITGNGFNRGYLKDLEGYKFTHNPEGGDQKIQLEVKQAVFTANERIDMVLDLDWPALNAKLENQRGFSTWGDYSIGFGEKNGSVPLVNQLNTEVKGYPATCNVIGAGSNEGYYAFATVVDIMLGEDVSGEKEAPKANIYSLMENPFVSKMATGPVATYENEPLTELDTSLLKKEEESDRNFIKSLNQKTGDIAKGAEAIKNQYLASKSKKFSVDEIFEGNNSATDKAFYIPKDSASRFNSKQEKIIKEIAEGLVYELVIQLMKPVDSRIDSLYYNIERETLDLLAKAGNQVNEVVPSITKKIADNLVNLLQNDKIDVSRSIYQIKEATDRSITSEINNSLLLSTEENILLPIRTLLQENIKGRIREHIVTHGSEAIYFTITGNNRASKTSFENLANEMPEVIEDIIRDTGGFVSFENIQSTITGLVQDAINNIDVKATTNRIRIEAEEILKEEINQVLADAAADALGDKMGDVGVTALSDAPLDFVGMGSRLAKGDVKGALALDPIHVKLNTPVIELDGYIQYSPDNPTYGDVWTGDIDMAIKVPKPFAMNAVYINGRKDNLPYWFVQITPPRGNGDPYAIGTPLPKKAKPLPRPADLGIAKVMAASGRLYHHMREESTGHIVPDSEMRYGAFMHFVFFDKTKEGKNMRLEVSGEINSKENGDFTVAFDGGLQLQSESPRILEPDQYAAIQGSVMIRYNSAEKHFLGYAKVVLNKPKEICGEGSLLVDVKPKKWRVALGSREERLIFVPGCMGWSPTGWLDLNQSVAEIGLGLQWSMTGTYPSSDVPLIIGPYNARFIVDAGLAFGVLAAVQYRPLALQKAGIWADLWALVILEHKLVTSKKWKSKRLVDILLKGDLILYFVPKPTTLEGNMRGHIKVLFFNKEINASVTKEIS